jgi:hypothetical protein
MKSDVVERGPAEGEGLETVAATFRASEQIFGGMGARLYAELCKGVVGSPELLEMGARALAAARPAHLFSAVHYLLLRDPEPRLSRFFATLSDDPPPPEAAFPEFDRYCLEHRDAILDILETRTVQTTYVERCAALMPLVSFVADQAGEPLNLIEIGCSAGVLLAFDKYAYEVTGRGRVGAAGATLILDAEVHGGPVPRIPQIGTRVGLDLHPVDCRSEEERRWLLALCFPELRDEQRRLAAALDIVAQTEMTMLEGDAMEHLRDVLARTPDPVCVFSSACLFYWSREARVALEELLIAASRGREFYRVSLEPTEDYDAWAKGRSPGAADGVASLQPSTGLATIIRYRDGVAEGRAVAQKLGPLSGLRWIDDRTF